MPTNQNVFTSLKLNNEKQPQEVAGTTTIENALIVDSRLKRCIIESGHESDSVTQTLVTYMRPGFNDEGFIEPSTRVVMATLNPGENSPLNLYITLIDDTPPRTFDNVYQQSGGRHLTYQQDLPTGEFPNFQKDTLGALVNIGDVVFIRVIGASPLTPYRIEFNTTAHPMVNHYKNRLRLAFTDEDNVDAQRHLTDEMIEGWGVPHYVYITDDDIIGIEVTSKTDEYIEYSIIDGYGCFDSFSSIVLIDKNSPSIGYNLNQGAIDPGTGIVYPDVPVVASVVVPYSATASTNYLENPVLQVVPLASLLLHAPDSLDGGYLRVEGNGGISLQPISTTDPMDGLTSSGVNIEFDGDRNGGVSVNNEGEYTFFLPDLGFMNHIYNISNTTPKVFIREGVQTQPDYNGTSDVVSTSAYLVFPNILHTEDVKVGDKIFLRFRGFSSLASLNIMFNVIRYNPDYSFDELYEDHYLNCIDAPVEVLEKLNPFAKVLAMKESPDWLRISSDRTVGLEVSRVEANDAIYFKYIEGYDTFDYPSESLVIGEYPPKFYFGKVIPDSTPSDNIDGEAFSTSALVPTVIIPYEDNLAGTPTVAIKPLGEVLRKSVNSSGIQNTEGGFVQIGIDNKIDLVPFNEMLFRERLPSANSSGWVYGTTDLTGKIIRFTSPTSYDLVDLPKNPIKPLGSPILTNNQVLSADVLNVVVGNGGPVTVLLPANPTVDDCVDVYWINGDSVHHSLSPNGQCIRSLYEPITITRTYMVRYRFVGTIATINRGWEISSLGIE